MGYYEARAGMTVEELVRKWVDGDKAYDHSMPIRMSIVDLWQCRDYTWTRDTARAGYGDRYGGQSNYYSSGADKWDALKKSINDEWDRNDPLILNVGKDGKAKIGEGNHRLAVARELGLRDIPVRVIFVDEVFSTSETSRPPAQVLKGFREFLDYLES